MWYKNIAGRFSGLVTEHACDKRTDRRTDGQTELRLSIKEHASIAASRGKNVRVEIPIYRLLADMNSVCEFL